MLAKFGQGWLPWWTLLIDMGLFLFSGPIRSKKTQKALASVPSGSHTKLKITRRTTGARGFNFLTNFEQFWMIWKYLELYRTIFSVHLCLFWSILVKLGLSCSILGYLGLSQAMSENPWLSLAISNYLWLSANLWLSRVIPGYIQLSRFILSYFWAISGNHWIYLAISAYLWLFLAIWGLLGISRDT